MYLIKVTICFYVDNYIATNNRLFQTCMLHASQEQLQSNNPYQKGFYEPFYFELGNTEEISDKLNDWNNVFVIKRRSRTTLQQSDMILCSVFWRYFCWSLAKDIISIRFQLSEGLLLSCLGIMCTSRLMWSCLKYLPSCTCCQGFYCLQWRN